MDELSDILEKARGGEGADAGELLQPIYNELRKLAAHKLAQEAPGHTLQPTALVHEAWLRLLGPEEQARFENRAHFFGAAAEAMRRILVESARRKKRLKHGGQLERVDIDAVDLPLPMPADELLALDEALQGLATVDTRAAEVVNLCFFAGLTQQQAAKHLGVSLATASASGALPAHGCSGRWEGTAMQPPEAPELFEGSRASASHDYLGAEVPS